MAELPKTETEFVDALRPHLAEILKVMDEAVAAGITISFGLGLDPGNNRHSITALNATKSHLR